MTQYKRKKYAHTHTPTLIHLSHIHGTYARMRRLASARRIRGVSAWLWFMVAAMMVFALLIHGERVRQHWRVVSGLGRGGVVGAGLGASPGRKPPVPVFEKIVSYRTS